MEVLTESLFYITRITVSEGLSKKAVINTYFVFVFDLSNHYDQQLEEAKLRKSEYIFGYIWNCPILKT